MGEEGAFALRFPPEALEALAQRIAELIRPIIETGADRHRWIDLEGAANHLSTTPDAIRGMVKRGQIPVARTPTGRLLFDRNEIDAWVKQSCREP